MAAAASSSRSLAAACVVLAVLLAGGLAATADARRLLYDTTPAMPPVADGMDYMAMSPALAPGPEPGADDDLAGTMLLHGRGLLDGGLRLAGRLLLGLGL